MGRLSKECWGGPAMKSFDELNYYERLELPSHATDAEIRAAYERLDAQSKDSEEQGAQQRRAGLLEAMEILTEPDLRVEYDRSLGLPKQAPPAQLTLKEVLTEPDSASSMPAKSPAPATPQEPPASTSEAPSKSAVRPAAPSPPSDRSGQPPPRKAAPELATESAVNIAEASLAQVSARVREARASSVSPPRPVELPADAVVTGELLRRAREGRGITLAQLSERTRIGVRHLESVEGDRYQALPATVYLRGILMSMARELGLDPLRVSSGYLALVSKQKKEG